VRGRVASRAGVSVIWLSVFLGRGFGKKKGRKEKKVIHLIPLRCEQGVSG